MFTSEFKPKKCIEGEILQLKCSVYSEDINVEWSKDDAKVEQDDNISIETDGKDHFMTVKQAKLSDAGQYVMIAGNVRKQLTVNVEVLPEAINRLQEKDKARYIELMQSSEVEKRYFVRIMIVGKESVGKTSLVRRLLKEEKIDDVTSTDGVDIVVHRCKINIDDGKWMIDKFTSDDKGDRIHRAVKNERIKKDMPTNISHEQSNTSSVIASNNEFKHYEVQAKKPNDISDTTSLYELEPSTPMFEEMSENSTDEEDSSLDSVSVATHDTKDNDQALETIDQIEGEDNIKDTINENVINTDTKDISIENEDSKKSLTLVMPPDLMSHVFSTTSTSNIPSNLYALCGLWDFAGQKEFYATHQAFLTSSALYLVVADMADNIFKEGKKQCFADFQNVGEYVDFWFDTIHCHRTVEPRKNKSFKDYIDPPVILVLTGKDKYEKDKESRKTDLQNQLDVVLRNQSKYHHLRRIFCLSNKTDPYNEFEKLQEEISTTVRGMKTWGEEMPLKWILLEHLIEINKNNGKNFINLSEMADLAKHRPINIIDIEEVKLFLCFQHEVGSIIYFEDIQDFIILKPKWLVDAFRCLVSDKIDDKLQHRTDSTKFVQNGQISESLIFELFKSKCGSQFSGQIANLLKVMEKFDILVKIGETSSYIMPSMMPSISFDELCKQIGVERPNCKRTSWLCLKFSFLPPAFFNHVSVWFIRKYSKAENEIQSLRLFRGICVFDIDRFGCKKLLVTMSTDTIAIQLLSFSTGKTELGSICISIREDLIENIKAIKDRYKLTLSYELHFKCSSGKYYEHTISYKTLKCSTEYQCNEHQEAHQSEEIYLPWMMNAEEVWQEFKDILDIHKRFLKSEFTQWLSEGNKDIPVNLQEVQVNLNKNKDMWKKMSDMRKELANAANRYENLGVNMEEPKQESNINQQAKKVDDNFKKATAELQKRINSGQDTIHRWELVDIMRRDLPNWLHHPQEKVHEIEGKPVIHLAEDTEIEKTNLQELHFLEIMNNKKTSSIAGENNIATISHEEENFVRMSLLLSGISDRAVRKLFDSEFDPSCLDAAFKKAYGKLKDLKIKRIINQLQWNLLFPHNGGPNSVMFDVNLMITLLTNLTKLNHYDEFPVVTDATPSADLARIKYYRNHISHNTDGKIDSLFFSTAWGDIIEAIGRLGGKSMLDECKELRTKLLEQSTVPWNIRKQISQVLESWKMNNFNFVETRAAKHVLECVQENSCVTITSSSGVGKTAILQYVALKMIGEGYDVLPVTNGHDIIKFYNPNQKTLYVIDDFCGTDSINQFEFNSLESVMRYLKVLIQNKLLKIIVACRLRVYQDDKFESLSMFRTCVCNLLSEDLSLSQSEKQSIAALYLDTKASEIIQYCDLYDWFPLLCKLYSENPDLNITDFFTNPLLVYEAEIDKLNTKTNYRKYCVLALCVMFNNRLHQELLTDEINTVIRTVIENTCKACGLDRGTSRLILMNELKTLEHTFIKKEQGVFKTIHDKLFDFLSFYFGKQIIQCLIKNAHSSVIMQRFVLERKDDMDQFITLVPRKYHKMYIQRMIDDWSIGRVQCVFYNINMKISEFKQIFLCYLNTLDKSFQRQLSLTCDVSYKDTVLLQCCYLGDIPFIRWCISHGVDINQCSRSDDVFPLLVSAHEGHTEVVKILLDNKADINKCDGNGISPLYIACQNNHLEIVRVLLDNKADINKCENIGVSPLHIACQNNHTEIVKVLLEKKADINKCTDNGSSPLFTSCQNNHIETVKVLLDNKAYINKCDDNGVSPLFAACRTNHIEIIKLLLGNKTDINKCDDCGVSPISVACFNNYIETVKVLLENKADINKCDGNEASPLFMACQNNHIETVKVLLENKVDINKCRDNGVSPLYIACQNNHIETVMVLLTNKADINKCDANGASPLFIACQNNHIVIVKILLDNKAHINKCDDNGASPLYIACQDNHIEIVKVLLDNKADINKCYDNDASPLYIACQNNHIEIVNVLLDNKADINKCRDNGVSSLFIACQNNRKEILKVLLFNKADINKCTDNGVSPLNVACQNNHIETVHILLNNKADINKCDDNGASALFMACQNNHKEVVKVLLYNKADINKCRDNGVSPLLIACHNNHTELVQILLDNNADINTCDDNGASSLFIACQNNHIEIVKILLDNKTDINKCRNDGISPLRIARHLHHFEIVKTLLDYKA